MEKTEKKSFLSRLLRFKSSNGGKRLYSNTKQTTTKIKIALLELLNNKELSQINITNLVKVAGVYRATFYLHYRSLDDVVKDIERDVCDCYYMLKVQLEDVDLYNNIDILIDKINEYIKIDKKYLSTIINAKCFTRITLNLKELLYDAIVENFTKFGHMRQDDEFLLKLSSFTGGLIFLYRDWINSLDIEFDKVDKFAKMWSKCLTE